MSKISNTILLNNALNNMTAQQEVINFIKAYPSEEGEKALKSYKYFWICAPIVIILTICIAIGSFFALNAYSVSQITPAPDGTMIEREGRVWNDATITYTYDKESYRIQLSDYQDDLNIMIPDDTKLYPPVDKVRVFLDESGNVVDIYPESKDWTVEFTLLGFADMLFIFFSVVLLNKAVKKKWGNYVKWYSYEILPIVEKENFKELLKTKKYYDPIMPKSNEIQDKETLAKYKRAKLFYVLFMLLFAAFVVILIVLLGDKRPQGLILSDYLVITAGVAILLPIILKFERKKDLYKAIIIQKYYTANN